MGSTPHSKHVYNVPNFDLIKEVQKKIIMEVCAGVDDQLNSLVSGEESKSNNNPTQSGPHSLLYLMEYLCITCAVGLI